MLIPYMYMSCFDRIGDITMSSLFMSEESVQFHVLFSGEYEDCGNYSPGNLVV